MKNCGCNCTCSSASPTEILKAEHRVIERVLTALERFVAQEVIDADAIRASIDFFRNFADGCHHAKEENELFPRLESAGIPREGGPIGCMLDDHQQGRALIRRMSDSVDLAARGDADACRSLRSAAAGYVELLRKHIWKEDNVLFELADQTLTADQQKAMLGGFDQTEQSEANSGKHDRYLRLADGLFERSLELSGSRMSGANT